MDTVWKWPGQEESMNVLELADVLQTKTKSVREGWGWPATEITAVPLHMSTVSPRAGTGMRVRVCSGSPALPHTIWGKQQVFSWHVQSFYSYTVKCYKKTSPSVYGPREVKGNLSVVFVMHCWRPYLKSQSCGISGTHDRSFLWLCFCCNLSHRKDATVWKPTRLLKEYCVFVAIYMLEGPLQEGSVRKQDYFRPGENFLGFKWSSKCSWSKLCDSSAY